MDITRLLVSFMELGLMVVASALIVVVIYRVFIRANPDFDMEEELARGNTAVGILLAVIMISAALMLAKGLTASISVFRLALSFPGESGLQVWQAGLLVCGHLLLTLAVAIVTISLTLRLFGLMSRRRNPDLRLGRELQQGNLAVGIILAAVVFIITMFIGDGISGLTKALVPQPKIGTIRVMK